MLWNRVLALFLFSLFSMVACSSEIDFLTDDLNGLAVLDSATQDQSTPKAAVGIIDGLYEIGRSSPKKDKIFVGLLDYYLGSAGGAVLDELISKRGDKILPLLQEKLESPVQCLENYRSICIENAKQRDSNIKLLIKAIQSDEVLCVDQSDC